MKVRLQTNSGGLVGEFILPDFMTIPEVLTWGVRVFTYQKDASSPTGAFVYKEAFYYTIVSDPENKEANAPGLNLQTRPPLNVLPFDKMRGTPVTQAEIQEDLHAGRYPMPVEDTDPDAA